MNRRFKLCLLTLFTFAFLLLLFPFHGEILLAAVFAFALDPLARYLVAHPIVHRSKINFRRKQWVTVILMGLFGLVFLPIAIAFYNVYATVSKATANGLQNTEFFQDLLKLRAAFIPRLERLVDALNFKRDIDLAALSDNALNSVGQKLLSWFAGLAAQLPNIVIFVFVFVCALYFFLAEHKTLRSALLKSGLISPPELDRIVLIFQKTCSSTILASVITGVIQAFVVALGSLIFKTGDVFLIFVITFFFSFIPVIGAAPVALLLGVLALVKGNYGVAAGFVVVAIIAGTLDNVIRPYLASGGESAHPLVVLISILGAIVVFGLPGLFLGPVIANATVMLYQEYILQ